MRTVGRAAGGRAAVNGAKVSIPPMAVLTALQAADVRSAMIAYRDVLRAHQDRINRLNVYPVPDGDTGTNMALTLDAVVAELQAAGDAGMGAVCKAIAHGSLMGARGNSGVILSQLLRGVAECFGRHEAVEAPVLADALATAASLAYKAVVRPVEGTILTVARAAGEAATTASSAAPADLPAVVASAREAAADALARTPELLAVLARAGVVDAGGAGYLLLFDALLHVVDGRALPALSGPDTLEGRAADVLAPLAGDRADTRGGLRFEVMYLLEAPDHAIDAFKEVWAGVGDSIVVVGGDGLWNCHIHTDDVGAAIEAGIDAGRPRSIRVTDLDEQVEEERWVREAASEPPSAHGPPPVTDVVAVVTGDGVGRIFRSLGVHAQVRGGQSMNPSTAELLAAVDGVESDQVVILPNNPNITPVAEQVDALTSKSVGVVPTGSVVEGFAALLAYDPEAGREANVAAMAASARRVVPGEVTRAVRDSHTEAGPVRTGQFIGLSREGVLSVGSSAALAACGLLERLLADHHELVTIIEGEGSSAADTRQITEWLHERHPGIATEVHHGGQPLYPYLLGIE